MRTCHIYLIHIDMIKKITLFSLTIITATVFHTEAQNFKKHENAITQRNAKIQKSIADPLKNKFQLSTAAQRKLSTRFLQTELIDYWNANTNQWDSVFRNTYIYNENNQIVLTTLTDVITGPGLQIEYYYDNGKVNEAVMRQYDSTNNRWQDWVRDLYTYDSKGRLAERFYQEWDTTWSIWLPRERETMIFNPQDLMSMYLLEYHDGSNWVGFEGLKLEYEFDLNNRNILDMAIYLDPSDQSWDTTDRMHHIFTSNGTLSENIYQIYVDGTWENANREEIKLDAQERATDLLFFAWDLANSEWDSTERFRDFVWFNWNGSINSSQVEEFVLEFYIDTAFVIEHKYVASRPDNYGSLIEERFVWVNDVWVSSSKSSTIFDEYSNQIDFIYEMYEDTAYVTVQRNKRDITYDGTSIVEMIDSEYDAMTGNLDLRTRFTYSLLQAVGLNTKKTESLQVYPNPVATGQHIGIELESTANASVEIYNLLGEKVATLCDNAWLEKGVHTFQIDLPAGIYQVQTRSNNKTYSNKILVQ